MEPSARSIAYKHHRPRAIDRCRLSFLVAIIAWIAIGSVTAQSSSLPPPAPQPGSDKPEAPTKTHGSNNVIIKGTITGSSAATITAPATPSIITTVSVINGTTSTLTLTVTPSILAQAAPNGSGLPKAVQSILVVQSTTFGKVLPAAPPPDDHIDSHFWDQFSHPDIPGSSNGRSSAHSNYHRPDLFNVLGWVVSFMTVLAIFSA
ncbi:hypothetical protein BGZ94_000945 [Podila epigama]|nr:hypothetical protein BGZ94_000945 [Podila epigama]